MQKKPLMFCGFTTMMGIFGAFLRWLQNMQGFETDSGLPITSSPWHLVVLIYLIGFAVWLFLDVRRMKGAVRPSKYPEAFACDSKIWRGGAVVFSLLMAVSAVITLFDVVNADPEDRSVFSLILGLFGIICAICYMSFINGTRGKNSKNGGFAGIVIVVFYCYHLIATYKTFASEPVTWHFAIQILSVAACLLAFYYISGFAYGSPRVLPTIYFCHLGAFLAVISCADSVATGINLIAIAAAGMLLLISYAQLQNIAPAQNTSEESPEGSTTE